MATIEQQVHRYNLVMRYAHNQSDEGWQQFLERMCTEMHIDELYKAASNLLDDLQETGDTHNPETREEYPDCAWLRETLAAFDHTMPWLKQKSETNG